MPLSLRPLEYLKKLLLLNGSSAEISDLIIHKKLVTNPVIRFPNFNLLTSKTKTDFN